LKVIVSGGRHYVDKTYVYNVLDAIHMSNPITLLIEGGAKGADGLANQWARDRNIQYHTEKANWAKYGRAAGPIRNNEMLMKKPNLVIAFPGGKGTLDMIRQATNLEIQVLDLGKGLHIE